MSNDSCDVQEMLAGLRSDFQQLKQHREKVFDGTNAFLDQLFESKFDGGKGVEYAIDFSEEESEDERPRVRLMAMRTQRIFEKKPVQEKPKPKVVQEAPPPPPVIKPVVLSTGCQTKKATMRTTETQSTATFQRTDHAVVATTQAETQTKSLRRRHETTNTESVLPSYENVCIAFLENLLSDAPVFLGQQGPNPGQVEDIIMEFLDQLMSDAKRMDVKAPAAASETQPRQTVFKAPAQMQDMSVQQTVATQSAATQSFVALKSLDAPKAIVHIGPDDGARRMWLSLTPCVTCFEVWPKFKRPLGFKEGDRFQFPPSLRTTPKPVLALRPNATSQFTVTGRAERSTGTQTQNTMLQIDVMNSEDVSVRPSRPGPEIPRTRPGVVANKPPPMPAPHLKQLQVTPLPEIEELSNFNLDSMMAEVDSTSDEELSQDVGYSSSIASSKISDILDGVSASPTGTSSESGLLSSGEIHDSTRSESGTDPWTWAK